MDSSAAEELANWSKKVSFPNPSDYFIPSRTDLKVEVELS